MKTGHHSKKRALFSSFEFSLDILTKFVDTYATIAFAGATHVAEEKLKEGGGGGRGGEGYIPGGGKPSIISNITVIYNGQRGKEAGQIAVHATAAVSRAPIGWINGCRARRLCIVDTCRPGY